MNALISAVGRDRTHPPTARVERGAWGMGRLWPPFALLVLLGLCLAAPAHAVEISGRVLNGTTGSSPVANVPVMLLQHGAGTAVHLSDTTDAQGRFSVTLSEAPSGEVPIILSAHYKGVDYRAQSPVTPDTPVDIPVYEITESDSTIALVSHHIILEAPTNQGHHIYIFQNSGNRTFRTGGGHGHGIEVPLPEGVTDFQAPQGVHNHGATLVDPRPVPPGGLQLSYSFALPADRRFVQRLVFATPALDLLVSPAEAEVVSTMLEDFGHVTLGDRHFRRFGAKDLAAGQQVSMTLGGAAPATAPVGMASGGDDELLSREMLPIILGVGAVVFGLLAIFYRSPRRVAAGSDLDLETRRSALLRQIADLDDRLEAGDLTPEQHKSRRDALKAEVVDLTNELDGA